MISNKKYRSLSEASELLGKTEQEVFELLKFNFLDGRTFQGRMSVSNESIEKYLKRFGKQKTMPQKPRGRVRNFTISEAARIVGSEKEVHRLIQNGTLSAGIANGVYIVYGHSMMTYAKEGF